MKMISTLAIASTAIAVAVPASAHDHKPYRGPVYDDSNSHYLDYKTDLSEAKRELRSDLRRANDEGDRIDAWAEYHREVADAKHDFAKEMAERGVNVNRRGTVQVIE